jgi:hypothetical protein
VKRCPIDRRTVSGCWFCAARRQQGSGESARRSCGARARPQLLVLLACECPCALGCFGKGVRSSRRAGPPFLARRGLLLLATRAAVAAPGFEEQLCSTGKGSAPGQLCRQRSVLASVLHTVQPLPCVPDTHLAGVHFVARLGGMRGGGGCSAASARGACREGGRAVSPQLERGTRRPRARHSHTGCSSRAGRKTGASEEDATDTCKGCLVSRGLAWSRPASGGVPRCPLACPVARVGFSACEARGAKRAGAGMPRCASPRRCTTCVARCHALAMGGCISAVSVGALHRSRLLHRAGDRNGPASSRAAYLRDTGPPGAPRRAGRQPSCAQSRPPRSLPSRPSRASLPPHPRRPASSPQPSSSLESTARMQAAGPHRRPRR